MLNVYCTPLKWPVQADGHFFEFYHTRALAPVKSAIFVSVPSNLITYYFHLLASHWSVARNRRCYSRQVVIGVTTFHQNIAAKELRCLRRRAPLLVETYSLTASIIAPVELLVL